MTPACISGICSSIENPKPGVLSWVGSYICSPFEGIGFIWGTPARARQLGVSRVTYGRRVLRSRVTYGRRGTLVSLHFTVSLSLGLSVLLSLSDQPRQCVCVCVCVCVCSISLSLFLIHTYTYTQVQFANETLAGRHDGAMFPPPSRPDSPS